MKKILLLLLAIGHLTICNAQQFSFQMNFEDSAGNKDSLTLGYDQLGTDTLDAIFNETNIISVPYSSGLDIRVGNDFMKQNFLAFGTQTSFQTKTQIVPDSCGEDVVSGYQLIEVDILTSHWPVKASWNSTLFNDTCRNGSVFTGVHPGGWWDTGGFRAVLDSTDSITFFPNIYYYLDGTDTMRTYWVAFLDSSLLSLGITETTINNLISIYPNPASDIVSLNLNKNFVNLKNIEFYNSIGQIVLTSITFNDIDISKLPRGLYFIKITNSKGWTVITKLAKV